LIIEEISSRLGVMARRETIPTGDGGVDRGVPPWVDVAEDALGEDPVAAHDVQQPGDAGVGGERGGDGGGEGGGHEQHLEELAADEQRHLGQGVVGHAEVGDVREDRLRDLAGDQEDAAADEQGDDDRLADVGLVAGFLGVHGDRVEADEGEADDGRAGEHRGQGDAGVEQRLGAEHGAGAHAVGQLHDGQPDERDDHDDGRTRPG
jgi:hypothetical protein